MSHLGNANKMVSDTPISDSTPHNVAELGMLCRRLERKLNAANERIKRLVQAGDCLLSHRNSTDYHEKVREWDKAKKDKP